MIFWSHGDIKHLAQVTDHSHAEVLPPLQHLVHIPGPVHWCSIDVSHNITRLQTCHVRRRVLNNTEKYFITQCRKILVRQNFSKNIFKKNISQVRKIFDNMTRENYFNIVTDRNMSIPWLMLTDKCCLFINSSMI